MLMGLLKQTAKRQPQRSAVPLKSKPCPSHKICPQRIATGSTTVPPWKWSKMSVRFPPKSGCSFLFCNIFSELMQKPLYIRCKQSNAAGIYLFWASVQNVIFWELCLFRWWVWYWTVFITVLFSVCAPSFLQHVEVFSAWYFVCDLLRNCKKPKMDFVGFAVLFMVDLPLMSPTCLHSTVTVAGLQVYIYC